MRLIHLLQHKKSKKVLAASTNKDVAKKLLNKMKVKTYNVVTVERFTKDDTKLIKVGGSKW